MGRETLQMKEASSPIRRRFEEYFGFLKLKGKGKVVGDWNSEAILNLIVIID
jgi:hypothetical protein